MFFTLEKLTAAAGTQQTGPTASDFVVFNSATRSRTDLLFVPFAAAGPDGRWESGNGAELAAVRSTDGWHILLDKLPALGMERIRRLSGAATNPEATNSPTGPFRFTGRAFTTPFYELEWNDQGQLARVYDRGQRREVLEPGGRGNVLQVFEDKPLAHDAWDIDIFYRDKAYEIDRLHALDVVSLNALYAELRFEWRFDESVVVQHVKAYAHSPRIDFVTDVDWRQRQQLLKAAFHVDVRATEATYDIQFGNVRRPTHWNTNWDYARFESVGHRWADLSERGYGVALLNDCKYGYDIKDKTLRLSLLRSPIHPDPEADLGRHRFTYALLPHRGDFLTGRVADEAWALNNPLLCAAGPGSSVLAAGAFSLLSTDCDHVHVDAIKKAEDEDAAVVWLHEYGGQRDRVEFRSDAAVLWWQETDLLERPTGERRYGTPISLEVKPYEIITLLIRFGGAN